MKVTAERLREIRSNQPPTTADEAYAQQRTAKHNERAVGPSLQAALDEWLTGAPPDAR